MPENNELAVVLRLVADQFKTELRASQGAIGAFNEFLKDWRTQMTAVGTALFAVAKSTADFGEEMLKGAQKTGMTVQAFSTLSHAAKMADLDNQQLITGLKTLSVNMVEAQHKTGDGEAIFRRLGISAVDTTGKLRPTEDVLLDVAEAFSKYADGAGKTEASTKLFGKAGLELIPFLNQGRAGIEELREAARRLGIELSDDDVKASDQFNQKLKELDATVKALTVSIGLPLVRGLTEVWQLFTEVEAAVGRAWKEMEGFSAHLSENFGKTGLGQGFMDVFSTMGLGHRKGEGPGANEQALLNALGIKPKTGRDVQMEAVKPPMPSVDSSKPFDQVAHVKAVLEIWLMGNRALEIQNKLIREQLDLFFRQEEISDQTRQERDASEREMVARGVADAEKVLAAQAAAEQQERAGLVTLAQAWVEYDNQVGASRDERYGHQMDVLRATLTKETQLTQGEAARLVLAWQNNDRQLAQDILARTNLTGQQREIIERQYLARLAALHQEYTGSVFDGWRRGLENYVRNTDSAFGFASQMAQRTAQFMEQNFRQFFFDAMDNKIKSLKDLFASFANFAKQMIAQVLAQLATMMALKAATAVFSGGLGGLFGGFGGAVGGGANAGGLFGGLQFASGGPVLGAGNRDTVRALLTPGEGVLNRRGMEALAQLNTGSVPGSAAQQPVTIHFHGVVADQQPKVNVRRQFESMVIDVFLKNRAELGFGY